jgi:catechol 2,3-dioxygenase-like lactoylglutathione lyase family enzyme
MSNDNNTLTLGVHHAGLTVPDLAATRAFFVEGLGFEQVGEKPDYPAVFLSDGGTMITLWQAEQPDAATRFDRGNNIGLHHLAFAASDLEAVQARISDWPDVEIEFEPEQLGGGATRHMMCSIPGGIRVEFIAPATH